MNSDGKLHSKEDEIVMQPPLLPGMSTYLLVQCSLLKCSSRSQGLHFCMSQADSKGVIMTWQQHPDIQYLICLLNDKYCSGNYILNFSNLVFEIRRYLQIGGENTHFKKCGRNEILHIKIKFVIVILVFKYTAMSVHI